MAGSVRTVNAEVNLKGTANQELGKLNQNLDKTEQGFTSLSEQMEITANAQSQGALTMQFWSQAFMAVVGMNIADTFLTIATGAFKFAWAADEADLSTVGWMRTVQEFIAEYLEPFVDFVKELVDGFTDLTEWLFNTDAGMRLIYATLITLSPLIAYFLVYGIWLVIKATYAWVAANWALIVSYAPLVLMWLAIAAAVAAVILVVEDFITWMQGGESYFGDWLGEWKGFGQAFSDIWSKSIGWIKEKALAVWDWMKSAASGAWNWIKSFFSGDSVSFGSIFGTIGSSFADTWEWIKTAAGEAWEWLKTKFWQFSDFLAAEFPGIGKFIHDYLITPLNFVLGIVQSVLNFIGLFNSKFADAASSLGEMRQSLDKFATQRGLPAGVQGPAEASVASASYQPQLKFELNGARAGGGDVDPFGTYLVGEQGPELLRMGARGGAITPNSALGGGGRGNVYQVGPFYVTATSDAIGQSVASQLRTALDSLFSQEYAAEAGMV